MWRHEITYRAPRIGLILLCRSGKPGGRRCILQLILHEVNDPVHECISHVHGVAGTNSHIRITVQDQIFEILIRHNRAGLAESRKDRLRIELRCTTFWLSCVRWRCQKLDAGSPNRHDGSKKDQSAYCESSNRLVTSQPYSVFLN
jgi:hypothetical protein